MRRLTVCGIALVLLGCGGKEAEDTDAAVGETPAAEAEMATTPSLAEWAGTWHVQSSVQGNPAAKVEYDLIATEDRSGWSIKFPGRDPIPLRIVAVEGDSVVSEAGPFESMLRKGVQVTTHVVSRMQDGKMVGTTHAKYAVAGADSTAVLTFEGTRK